MEKFPWRRDRLPTPVLLGLPGGSDSKEPICNARPGFDPWVVKISLKEGMATHCCILAQRILGRAAWRATVHGVTKSQMQLSDFHVHVENLKRQKGLKFTFPFPGYIAIQED